MGVHNLWELLSPVGRRVNVETLAGKKLAIDASIWMVQFIKAMRDEKGEMVKNAHILGFFRRICKLLFLRVKPVFVFDGATPVLKRRTVAARRRQRDNAHTNMRKTAEKLLLNHMKTYRLQQLAENLKNQRQQNNAKGKRKTKDKEHKAAHTSEGKKPVSGSSNQEVIDEMLAASLAAEEDGSQMNHAATSAADAKGKRKITDIASDGKEPVSGSYNQEAIDEMLAASLAAEEDGRQMHNASTSAASVPFEEEDDEADEEMILPTMHGQMDPAVLAALPPSMQLDLLAQMRERLMAENRQKYQKVKKVPERFSELQIQSYLKTVAFRRDIDEVRKSAAGKGIGGVQTSRIASEPNREFVYSSSFTGDKQVLVTAGLDQNRHEQEQMPVAPSSNTSDGAVPTKMSSASGSVADHSNNMIHNDVETYLDERGRVRVSRVRAMGLRMTRDLQRNLDLMKESEVESLNTAVNSSSAGVSEEFPSEMQPPEILDQGNHEIAAHPRSDEFINTRTPLEVTFDVDGENRDDDDDLFTRLVAGDSDLGFCSDEEILKKQCSSSDSDCEWEEGVILDKNNIHHEVEVGEYPSTMHNRECHETNLELEEGLLDGQIYASSCLSNYKESDMNADTGNDVEWEDGSFDIPGHTFSCQPIYKEVVSKGDMEEEINFQEAIKRSLEDLGREEHINVSPENKKHDEGQEVDKEGMPSGSNNHIKHLVVLEVSAETVIQPIDSKICGGTQRLNNVEFDIPITNNPPLVPSESCTDVGSDDAAPLIHRAGDSTQNNQTDIGQNGSGSSMSYAESECLKSGAPTEEKGGNLVEKKLLRTVCETFPSFGTSSQIGQVQPGNNCTPGISSDSVSPDVSLTISNAQQFDLKNPSMEHLTGAGEFINSFVKESIKNDTVQSLAEGNNYDVVNDVNNFTENSVMMDSLKEPVENTWANWEEQMQRLLEERLLLGGEQRKLERNAETVSSEMFTECQELLQMFGLPYIIAPMEAEAQCAFMELENLVDGVVTDDSDVLLFGARSVYKNIFDDRKYVETYLMKDIENELGLTREKLIRMALLLGSDYTEGVSGIGIVNAIEVINAFPEENGLRQFREWVESPDPAILGKAEVCSKTSLEGAVDGPVDDLLKKKQHFMNKHRKVSKNWHIPFTFPSEAVISAYNSPQVDKSTESFSWGKPDQFVLRKLCLEKFRWGTQKADEVLVPVLNEYNKHETQLRLEAFYSFSERFAKIRSKRVKEAVKLTMGDKDSGLMDDTKQGNSKGRKRRKPSSNRAGSGEDVSIPDGLVAGHESKSKEAATADCSRKKRVHGKPCPPEGQNSESLMQAVGRENTNGGSKLSGRGRSRGRGRGRSGKRGRGKERSTLDCAEISSRDETDKDQSDEKHDRSHQVRRSTRPRKAVRYAMNDSDGDELADASEDSGSSVDAGGKELLANRRMGTAYHGSASDLQHHELNHLPVEPSSDNIQLGSGFCPDEAELNIGTDHVDLDQNGYTNSNADEDYLKTGGGFCFEDDDVENDTRTHSNADEVYLKTGGGFRFEDDDVENDTRAHSNADEVYLKTGGGFCFEDDDVDNDTHTHSNAYEDYLKTGGGFCFEDDGVVNDSHKHSNADGDYLKTGGGFCFEDVDNDKERSADSPTRDVLQDNDTGKSAYSPTRIILNDNDNPSNCSVSNSRSADEIQAGKHTAKTYDMQNPGNANVAQSSNTVVGDDPGARSGQFLSAMPNLRRKRKS